MKSNHTTLGFGGYKRHFTLCSRVRQRFKESHFYISSKIEKEDFPEVENRFKMNSLV